MKRHSPPRVMASLRGHRIHVLITEPHNILRRGLRDLLMEHRDVEAVSEARTGHEALTAIRAIMYNVVLVGLRLPDGDGVELARRLRASRSGIRVVILTERADRPAVLRAMTAGVHGFVQLGDDEKELVSTIVDVGRGKKPFDPTTATSLAREPVPRPPLDRLLSAHERLVLELLAEGLPDREIAGRADLAEETVRSYISRALRKLGVRARGDQALYPPRDAAAGRRA